MSGLILINVFHGTDLFTTNENYHPGGSPNNAFDGNTYTKFKPSSQYSWSISGIENINPVIVDTFAISGIKNIPDDLTNIKLIGADNPEFSNPNTIALISKSDIDNGILMATSSNNIAYGNIRIQISTSETPINSVEISNIIIGKRVNKPGGIAAPYTPPKLSAKTEILNNRTMGGNFVGRSVLSGQYDFIIKNKNVSPEWIEENWLDLHKQISEKPFMYLWDDTRPQDAVFCWTKGDIPPPKYDNQCYFSFSIPCNGFIEND